MVNSSSAEANSSKKTTSRRRVGAGNGRSGQRAHVLGAAEDDSKSSAHRGIRRRPKQDRASATVDAILQAAAELFCDPGYDRASTNRIAERAGVSIGSLYQYFANKEAILEALLEEHRRLVHVVVEEALVALDDPGVSLRAGLTTLLTSLIDFHAEDPELNRVLSEEVPHLTHGSSNGEEIDHYAARVVAMLQRRPDVRVVDLKTSAVLLVTTVEALTRWLAHGAPAVMDHSGLIRETVTMLAGYLQADTVNRSG